MKKVGILWAAVPATLGLAVPTANAATATTPSPHAKSVSVAPLTAFGSSSVTPDTASNCTQIGIPCLEVIGTNNTVNYASLYHNATRSGHFANGDILYLGYTTPDRGAESKWKHYSVTNTTTKGHEWHPACSFSTGAHVSGWTKDLGRRYLAKVEVGGDSFNNKHDCA